MPKLVGGYLLKPTEVAPFLDGIDLNDNRDRDNMTSTVRLRAWHRFVLPDDVRFTIPMANCVFYFSNFSSTFNIPV